MLGGYCPQLLADSLSCSEDPTRQQLCRVQIPANPTPVTPQAVWGEQEHSQVLEEYEEMRKLLRGMEGSEARGLPAQPNHLLDRVKLSASLKPKGAIGQLTSKEHIYPPLNEQYWSCSLEEVEQWAPRRCHSPPAHQVVQTLQCHADPLLPGDNEEIEAWFFNASWSAAVPDLQPLGETTGGCASSYSQYQGFDMEDQMVPDCWLPEE